MVMHCSHCLAPCEPDRLGDFVCCSYCGKVLGQFSGEKYMDHSRPLFDANFNNKNKKKKKKKNANLEKKKK